MDSYACYSNRNEKGYPGLHRILINLTVLFFIFFFFEKTGVAQKTNLTLNIKSAKYVDWSEGNSTKGCNFTTKFVTVYLGTQYIGSLKINEPTATYSLKIDSIDVPASGTITITFKYGYRHFCWDLFSSWGDATETKSYNQYVTFNANGTLNQQITTSFKDLPDSNPGSVVFDAEITAFQPLITTNSNKKCYNSAFNLTVQKNAPSFYTASCVYEWQYGYTVPDTLANNEFFNSFKYTIGSELLAAGQNCSNSYNCPDNLYSIYSAITYDTDYKFMYPYLDYYNNYNANKSSIAYYMANGIFQNSSSTLTYKDQAFLYSYFMGAFLEKNSTPAPYNIGSKVDWKPLTNNAGETFSFDPSSLLSPLTDHKTLSFHVRAKNGIKTGPYSVVNVQDLLPAPPKAASITTTASCLNSKTGTINITGITSPVPTNLYTYRIADISSPDYVKPGDQSPWGDEPVNLNGKSITLANQKAGQQKLYLGYQDASLSGCLSAQTFNIETLDDLNFTSGKTDVSCPGGSDGTITVNISKGAGDYSINANGNSVNNVNNYTFTGFSQGTFPIEVKDKCTSKNSSEAITQPTPVNINRVLSSKINPNCISPANGGFEIKATGGTNVYDYYIYNDVNGTTSGSPLASGVAQGGTWSNYAIPGGNYIISVKDNAHSQCFGDTIRRTLSAATPLSLGAPTVTNVKCFGENLGAIGITASGGSGSYNFSLKDSSSLKYDGLKFDKLYAGNYTVIVKNSNTTCSDAVSLLVPVGTSSKINIDLDPQDVRCEGEGNGQISASVSGGSNNYTSQWEIWEDEEWKLYDTYKSLLTGLDPGKYRLRVSDNIGCLPVYETETISQPTALVIKSVVPHDVRCFGEDGSISLGAEGGNGGYKFQYSKDQTSYKDYTPDSPIAADVYYLKVKDIKECETAWPDEVTINAPDAQLDFTSILSDYNGFNISCADSMNGSIAITPTGGNGTGYSGYTYLLDGYPSQNTPSFTGLSAGTRNLKLTDGRNCSITKEIKLTKPTPINLAVTDILHIPCYGLSTGMLSVSASGGISPYSYRINEGDFKLDGDFNNLSALRHKITVKDQNECLHSIDTTVKHQYNQIQTVLSPQDVRCFGENNGRIDALINGGSGDFDLLWEEKVNGSWQARETGLTTISPLQPGSYRLKVTDKVGCPSIFDSTDIHQPDAAISITEANLQDIQCFGEKGNISLSTEGGNGSYQYFYSRNGSLIQLYLSGAPLEKGTYRMQVKDKKGCEALWPSDLVITEPSQAMDYNYFLSNYNGFNISCFGNNNGRLAIKSWGGNGAGYEGYSYLLSTRPIQTDSVFTELIAGNYQLTVKDGRGCSITRAITLTQPVATLSLEVASMIDTKCFNDSSGTITLSANGGVQPFTYKIGQESFKASETFEKLPVGKYQFTVKDVNGCIQFLDTAIHHILPKPSISLIPQEISCYGHADGQIQALLTGGSGDFALQWHQKVNGLWKYIKSDETIITQLAPGNYRLQATDKAGCPSIYDTTTVYQWVTPLLIDKVDLHDIRCYGDSGSIDIQASGSNGGYIYQYSKNEQPYQNYNPGSPLPFASYKLRVLDAKGCETLWPQVQTITTPAQALDFDWTLKKYNGYNVSCSGNKDGRLAVNALGGNGSNYNGYTYILSGRESQRESVFDTLTSGSYDLTVIDARECSLIKSVTLTQPPSKIKLWTTLVKPATCHYDVNGKIALAASEGEAPYKYRIGNKEYTEANEFNDLAVGTYSFTVKDVNGCLQFLDTAIINTAPKMEITGSVSHVKCFGQNNGAVNVSIAGGVSPLSYNWKENGAVTRDLAQLYKGIYSLTVLDSAGCKEDTLFEVREPDLPFSITAESESACAQTPNGVVYPQATGGTPPYFFALDDSLAVKEVPQLLTYGGSFTVFAADSNNCRARAQVSVPVRNEMPSPNFMVATSRYALDTLVIKDVSVPKPDSITWVFSSDTKTITTEEFEPRIKYEEAGAYPVQMIGHFGTCDYVVEKLVSIAPFDPNATVKNSYQTGIESVELSPNPNNGQFKVKVALYNKQQIQMRIVDMNTKVWYTSSFPTNMELETDISLQGVTPGTYILWIVTDTDSKAIRFVVSQ